MRFDPRSFYIVMSFYTDYAVPALILTLDYTKTANSFPLPSHQVKLFRPYKYAKRQL